MSARVTVLGAGLAGCEAAWALAGRGIPVELWEMKPKRFSPAHRSPDFAELVCSNSLKAARVNSAAGLLKAEMERLSSLVVSAARDCAVPAGGALAVDRELFSKRITERICSHPLIAVKAGAEATDFPAEGRVIAATGPLTSDALAGRIRELCGGALSFYDAAAPIVEAASLNRGRVFPAARYGRGDGDYLNCPMNREEYENFVRELVAAERAPLHSFDQEGDLRVYEGCMPIEVLASRGADAIRFGPMKPVGLVDPKTGRRPWAVLQLRRENAEGTLYNLVGFQTNLKFPEQKRVFGMIPGLENAEYARYGVMHRNTFLDSPRLLDETFAFLSDRRIRFAGQITGVEGYVESAASGILAGLHTANELLGKEPVRFPAETMLGALSRHVSNRETKDFQPMGANMGALPPLSERIRDRQQRYQALAERSLRAMDRLGFPGTEERKTEE
ncbi:MAG TPA: methylenetetrahydrofolate--tRNA-(uracil(54)-C(5))-methyltransferase (FADH(2)-oxidizing) TrmFO [Candidatus Fimivivens faecavium]|nr:methylenetetrahydrofolate--tRNA-(uracil(54)-C(5))-methyltransferase (FADH(2)-oxidizing) TrmFO [Candidatus Fimivivens faecavium]